MTDQTFDGGTAAGWIFVTGLSDYGDRRGFAGDVGQQTEILLQRLSSILQQRGGNLKDVLKCNVYLSDIRTFQQMNDVFARFFPNEPPARTTVQAGLSSPDQLVEIDAVAFLEKDIAPDA